MKKLTTMFLSVVIALSLGACSAGATITTDPKPTETTATAAPDNTQASKAGNFFFPAYAG